MLMDIEEKPKPQQNVLVLCRVGGKGENGNAQCNNGMAGKATPVGML